MHRIILLFRNDLRLHDNYIINYALNAKYKNKEVLPIYCFDPRIFKDQSPYGTKKTGLIRSRFIMESVNTLRQNLKNINSNLLVSLEKPEEFIPKLINKEGSNTVVYQQEICYEEVLV